MVEWRCGSTGVCCRSCSSSQCRGIPSLRFSLYLFYFYSCSSYSLASVLFLPSWFFLFFSFLFLSSSFPLPCSPLFSFFSFLPLFSVFFSPQSPLSNRPLFPSLYSLSVLFSCLLLLPFFVLYYAFSSLKTPKHSFLFPSVFSFPLVLKISLSPLLFQYHLCSAPFPSSFSLFPPPSLFVSSLYTSPLFFLFFSPPLTLSLPWYL